MSQLILDEQLDLLLLLPRIQKWITAQRLHELRPGQIVLDDRVPEILRTLKQPTFITIDRGFWRRSLCHPGYCILHFALRLNQQHWLPRLLRSLLRVQEFGTRAARMGKVARISTTTIEYWQFSSPTFRRLAWQPGG